MTIVTLRVDPRPADGKCIECGDAPATMTMNGQHVCVPCSDVVSCRANRAIGRGIAALSRTFCQRHNDVCNPAATA